MTARLGTPRLHLRATDSTNERARALAAGGAPHGTLVTAGEQRAGRGRQGRTWTAPAGRALLISLVLRGWSIPPPLATAV
ncbi:MAG: biotin--[acetyl-CoA-carboxylase] ligase, partial [Solirubrobacteraceae bacterium]